MPEAAPSLRVVLGLESSGPGGAENMVVQLGIELARLGHEVSIATLREGWMTERARAAGLSVWVMPQQPGLDIGWIWRLARRLRRDRIDVFHTHEFAMNVFGGAASRLGRVACLSTVHGKRWIEERARRSRAYRVLMRLGVPVVAVSEDLARYLVETLEVPRERIELVHNGIPTPSADQTADQTPDRPSARASLGIPADGPLLVAVGNLYPVKDHASLLQALADLPGARVAIAGRGGEEENLRQLAGELALEDRVHLLGLRDDVDTILAAADVFVQPSISEGLPLALLEAMAAGLPAVVSRVGGMAEAVEDGVTGRLVPPSRPELLAEAIAGLLADPPSLSEMGRAARQRAEREFSVESMARRYLELYASLLGR